MNTELFNKILNKRIEKIRNVLEKKATEYSSSDNRLHNFDLAAQINNMTSEQALWGMSTKHLVSIIDMVEDSSNLTVEMIDEKIGDMINYLILLEAILLRNIFTKE